MNITDPDLTALVAGVLADVNDIAPRMVLADYLEEHEYSVLKWGANKSNKSGYSIGSRDGVQAAKPPQ